MTSVRFNTNSNFTNSSKIYRSLTIRELPARTITMWYGSAEEIPEGWYMCDGNTYNGYITPDLRGRFVLGVGQGFGLTNRTLGDNGGEETHTLTTAEIPSHSHTITDPGHTHPVNTYVVDDKNFSALPGQGPAADNQNLSGNSVSSGSNTTSITVNSNGGGNSHNNMPPFYALYYIMKCF